MILYLHGFRSSPQSFKARLMADAMRARGLAHAWTCPQLPASPAEAAALALSLAEAMLARDGGGHPGAERPGSGEGDHRPTQPAASLADPADPADPGSPAAPGNPERLTVIGSSLGGYYANWLAERIGCRAVLLNPAVHAARDLATQVGQPLTAYHGNEPFVFLPGYVDELAALASPVTRPDRYFLVACTGDEVLDWHEMAAHYAGCRQRIVEGGDHGISDFERWLPEVLDFALAPPPPSR